MTQHCNVFNCKVLKSLHNSIVLHCYAGTAQSFPAVEECSNQRKLGLLDYAMVSTATSVMGWRGGAVRSCPWIVPPAAMPACILLRMFCQDWPLPSRGCTFFPWYVQLQALCASYRRGKPSGTMTKQTGLIPVTLSCFFPGSLLSSSFSEPFPGVQNLKVIWAKMRSPLNISHIPTAIP